MDVCVYCRLGQTISFLVAEKFRNSFFLAVNASEKKNSKLSEQIKNVFKL